MKGILIRTVNFDFRFALFCLFPEDDKWYGRKLEINLRDFHRKSKDVFCSTIIFIYF